ncbi:AEC family transporter [Tepidicella baoligensis]|uniref:AEC family transporter n=1 Tax=Tepidicella baoligensis TaxID=2707016 RepID=UPI0015DB5171
MNFAQLLFPDFSLILCGYLLCRYTPLNRKVWEPIESLVYFFMFPVLLFHSIVRTPLEWQSATHMMGAGLTLGLAGILLAYSLPRWPWVGRGLDTRLHAASAQVAFRFNSFIVLALVDRVAGPQGMPLVAVLIGVCVPLFNVGAVFPMARHGQHGLLRELVRNPLIIATVSGLAANIAGLGIPDWLAPTTNRIGQAALALGLMAAGAGMQLGRMTQAKTLATLVLGIKHVLLPVAALLVAIAWQLDPTQTVVLLMFSAVPTASSCYVLAARMGYDGPYVAGLVTLSTLLGVLSLTFALGVLLPLR